MLKYQLMCGNLINRTIYENFNISEIVDDFIIQHCIELFNSKINWDGMFDLVEAKNRIKDGDNFFVGYYEKNVIGYCWLKQISDCEYYLYNVFIKETSTNRNYGATDLLYLIIKNHTKGIITSHIDEWNYKSQKVFLKLGFLKV
jgi:hypothetical protein